jgi:hypothetical protein
LPVFATGLLIHTIFITVSLNLERVFPGNLFVRLNTIFGFSIFVLFNYEPIQRWLAEYVGQQLLRNIVTGLLFLTALVMVWQFKFFLYIMAVFLVVGLLQPILVLISDTPELLNNNSKIETAKLGDSENLSFDGNLLSPNVYFILLDGYGSSRVLSDVFNFDNTDFKTSLNSKGFIETDSLAPYPLTYLSVGSIFDLDYIVKPNPQLYSSRVNFYPRMLSGDQAPQLIDLLGESGYQFEFFGNRWSGCSGKWVICRSSRFDSRYFLRVLVRDFPKPLLSEIDSLLAQPFDVNLREVAAIPSSLPTAHFIHVFSPHRPYLDFPHCETKPDVGLQDLDTSRGYGESIRCVIQPVLEAKSKLLDHDSKSIIWIFGDHGPNTGLVMTDPMGRWDVDDVSNRMEVASFVRIPASCGIQEGAEIGLVNIARLIVSCATGRNLSLLQERSFLAVYENSSEFGRVLEIKKD